MGYRLPRFTDETRRSLRIYRPSEGPNDDSVARSAECRSLEPLLLAAAWKKLISSGSQPGLRNASQRKAGFAKPAVAIVLAVLVLGTMLLLRPEWLAGRLSEASAAGQGGSDSSTSPHGQQLVAESARRLLAESSIKANVRFKATAFDHEVVGIGSYLQLGDGPEKLLRLEMKSQVGDQTATLQEICSEDEYWVRRDVPEVSTIVGRASLRPIRQAIARMSKDPNIDPIQTWIILGGLPRMMEELHRNWDFKPAAASEVEFVTADGRGVERMPVWIVEGEMKAGLLEYLKSHPKATANPAQIPTRVELILGRADQVFPLFPYRITYFRTPRASDDESAGAGGRVKPLCTLEFYGVYHTSDIDPREFAYDPGDQEVADLTQQFMQRLGLVGK